MDFLEIRILGPGCPVCNDLEKRTMNALIELNLAADLQKISDIEKMVEYKITHTPALLINGKVKSEGRVPSIREIKEWIEEEQGKKDQP
ncbi:MAG: thioredoxin family protein [Candidatus Aminicenantaceae bacterium]